MFWVVGNMGHNDEVGLVESFVVVVVVGGIVN